MFTEADIDQSGKITMAEFLSSTCMWISANEAVEVCTRIAGGRHAHGLQAFAGVSALRNSFEHVYSAFTTFDPGDSESGSEP
jgi:hypothetical protein